MCLNKIMLFYLVAVGSVIATSTVTPVKKSKLEVLAETNRRNKLLSASRLTIPSSISTGNSSSSSSVFGGAARVPTYRMGLQKLVYEETDENGKVVSTTMRVAVINFYGLWEMFFKRKFIDFSYYL